MVMHSAVVWLSFWFSTRFTKKKLDHSSGIYLYLKVFGFEVMLMIYKILLVFLKLKQGFNKFYSTIFYKRETDTHTHTDTNTKNTTRSMPRSVRTIVMHSSLDALPLPHPTNPPTLAPSPPPPPPLCSEELDVRA